MSTGLELPRHVARDSRCHRVSACPLSPPFICSVTAGVRFAMPLFFTTSDPGGGEGGTDDDADVDAGFWAAERLCEQWDAIAEDDLE